MKHFLIAGVTALLPLFMTAQEVAINNKAPKPAFETASLETASIGKTVKDLRRELRDKKQFAKTVAFFNEDFEGATGVQWSTSESGYNASFRMNDIKTLAFYSRAGALLYMVRTYGADKLPDREQRVIRNEYRGYNIFNVNEVHQNDAVIYVVHLQDDRNVKIVTVYEGATNIYRAYRKA